MHDHVDARASVAVVLVTMILLIYMAVGPKGKDQLLMSIVILLVLVLCMLLVPRGSGRNAPTIIHCKEPAAFVDEAVVYTNSENKSAKLSSITSSAADHASKSAGRFANAVRNASVAAEAVGAATVVAEEAEAMGASSPITDPPINVNTPNDRDVMPNDLASKPPLPQISGEIAELPLMVGVFGNNVETIKNEIEMNLTRGVCPEFIPAPGPTPSLYTSLAHASTQAQYNELVANNQEREWSPYELWNRRFRLETALAEDLLTYRRNAGLGPADTHLHEITPELAAQVIVESQAISQPAVMSNAEGTHIGHI
jgi:hypothetical protein